MRVWSTRRVREGSQEEGVRKAQLGQRGRLSKRVSRRARRELKRLTVVPRASRLEAWAWPLGRALPWPPGGCCSGFLGRWLSRSPLTGRLGVRSSQAGAHGGQANRRSSASQRRSELGGQGSGLWGVDHRGLRWQVGLGEQWVWGELAKQEPGPWLQRGPAQGSAGLRLGPSRARFSF